MLVTAIVVTAVAAFFALVYTFVCSGVFPSMNVPCFEIKTELLVCRALPAHVKGLCGFFTF
eukprot:COSAG05_NODE_4525_length_1478_cov_1.819434_2_plen_60_part_01